MSAVMPPTARIGFGEVRHQRLSPVRHGFAYPTSFLLLPMRALRAAPEPRIARNAPALFGFHDRDHGDGRADSLAWFDELLARAGIDDARGEVWLHCIPRQFGFAFKPVSFWYGHRVDGTLAAIVVEVNNTFGERHCYLLEPPGLAFGQELAARKVFHVSPFNTTQGEYRFRFMRTDLDGDPASSSAGRGRTAVRIEWHDDAGRPMLVTSVSGTIEPLGDKARRRALWGSPLMTLAIVARIHWQALRLWLRRLQIVSRPAPPAAFVTRGGALAPRAASSMQIPIPISSQGTDPA